MMSTLQVYVYLYLIVHLAHLSTALVCKSNEFPCRTLMTTRNDLQTLQLADSCMSKSDGIFCDGRCDCEVHGCKDEPSVECNRLRALCVSGGTAAQHSHRFGWITPVGSSQGFVWRHQCSWRVQLYSRERVELHVLHWSVPVGDQLSVYDANPVLSKSATGFRELRLLMQLRGGVSPRKKRVCSHSNKVFVVWQPSIALNTAQINSNRFSLSFLRGILKHQTKDQVASYNISWRPCGSADCPTGELSCPGEPGNCYTSSELCDGQWDCPQSGWDEKGCNKCNHDEYSCGERDKACYKTGQRCDGHAECKDASDEMYCTAQFCGPSNGTYLCAGHQGRCIYRKWLCDGARDCPGGEDEVDCPPPPPSLTLVLASVVGSLLCALLLVVTIGYVCRVAQVRRYVRRQAAASSRRGCGSAVPRPALWSLLPRPPPPYDEAMRTSRPYEEVLAERRSHLQQERLENSAGTPDSDDVPLLSAESEPVATNSADVPLLDSESVTQVEHTTDTRTTDTRHTDTEI